MHTSAMRGLLERFAGHGWTIGRDIQHRLGSSVTDRSEVRTITVADPRLGALALRVDLDHRPGDRTLLVIVHGLGGDASSPYCLRMAAEARRRGWASVRVNLRGADALGDDLYHAGLTDDLDAIVGSLAERYDDVVVVGWSLGGHVVLRYGLRGVAKHPKVRALAAVCAPLDLDRSCVGIDRPSALVYRHVVLWSLKRAFDRVHRRRRLPIDPTEVARVRTIRQWDRVVVAPRHGFASAEDYYEKMSVGPRLPELEVPALWVGARWDPMVPAWTVEPALRRAPASLDVHMLRRGGHVGFPGDLQLHGQTGAIETLVAGWLQRRL